LTDGVRLTDFWERMADALGPQYCRYWADTQVLAELSGRTVSVALADGDDAGAVWRAVREHLRLPASKR
jgi:hypothetical protein